MKRFWRSSSSSSSTSPPSSCLEPGRVVVSCRRRTFGGGSRSTLSSSEGPHLLRARPPRQGRCRRASSLRSSAASRRGRVASASAVRPVPATASTGRPAATLSDTSVIAISPPFTAPSPTAGGRRSRLRGARSTAPRRPSSSPGTSTKWVWFGSGGRRRRAGGLLARPAGERPATITRRAASPTPAARAPGRRRRITPASVPPSDDRRAGGARCAHERVGVRFERGHPGGVELARAADRDDRRPRRLDPEQPDCGRNVLVVLRADRERAAPGFCLEDVRRLHRPIVRRREPGRGPVAPEGRPGRGGLVLQLTRLRHANRRADRAADSARDRPGILARGGVCAGRDGARR